MRDNLNLHTDEHERCQCRVIQGLEQRRAFTKEFRASQPRPVYRREPMCRRIETGRIKFDSSSGWARPLSSPNRIRNIARGGATRAENNRAPLSKKPERREAVRPFGFFFASLSSVSQDLL
jgi:peptide methionine sulfoxide reductase MsrB